MEWHQGTCYLNGKWMPLADASISVLAVRFCSDESRPDFED